MPISIVLADDYPIFLQGLKSLLEHKGFSVIGCANDGFEAAKLAKKFAPDVAVLDFSMPRLNGLGAAIEIRSVSPRTKIIFLTVHREEQYVQEAMSAGAMAYVLKADAATSLVTAIQEVNSGRAYLSPGIARFAVNSCLAKCVDRTAAEVLTPRELQVLRMIAERNTTRAIAGKLTLSVKATESHRMELMRKLDIHETAGLVRYAIRRGLIQA